MKILKIIGVTFLSILAFAYFAFLFVLPNAINLNNYKSDINKIVKDTAGLEFDSQDIKLLTTWNLQTKIALNNVSIKYPNKKDFLSAKYGEAGLKLLPLTLLNIELAPIKFDEPQLSIAIEKDGNYDIINFLNSFLSTPQPQQTTTQPQLPIKISNNLPDIILSNYSIKLKDEKTKDVMQVKGQEFRISEFKLGDKVKINTIGEIAVNDKKHVTYKAQIASFLPTLENSSTSNTTAPTVIPEFKYNPIPVIKKYNFGANLDTNIKISQDKNNILLNGYLNATELNYKIQNQNIDKSFLKLAFKGNQININSNLFVNKTEKFIIEGLFKNAKQQSISLHINSKKIKLTDIQKILVALCDIINLKNDIAQLQLTGYLDSNFTIKSDMKKIESDGYMNVENANISHKSIPLKITDIKSNLDFSGNKVTIKNTSAKINNSLFTILGTIDTNANADVKINAEKLPLNLLYDAFAPVETKKTLKLTDGTLTLNAIIKGRLDKIEPKVIVVLDKLKVKETSLNAALTTNSINVDLTANTKGEFSGNAKANTFLFTLDNPKTKISLPVGEIGFDTKNITIKPSNLYLDNSMFTLSGNIADYTGKINAIINAEGKLVASDILKYVPKEAKDFVIVKGSLPIIAQLSSDGKNTKINGQMLATPQNYISLLNIDSINGKSSLTNVDIETDLNTLKLNDIGLYGLNTNITLNKNLKYNLASSFKLGNISGKISNLMAKTQTLQNIKILTPNLISASLPSFKNSKLTAKADMSINGTTLAPAIKGTISIPTINIPDFMFIGKNITVNLTKDVINAKSPEIDLNGSKISFDTDISTNFGENTIINNLIINSNDMDVDKLFTIMEAMPQTNVAPAASVPVIIKKGHGTLSKVTSGTLVATNASGDFTLKNNIFDLKNLKATAYNGIVAGNVSYNIPYETTKAKIQGRGLDSNSAITAFAGLKDQIQGKLDFDADISMVGMTYKQQMKTLKGTVDFSIGEGQMGSLGRLEHFIYASNLISQKFAQSTLNSVIQTLAPKNTGKFQHLKGHLTFDNGWAKLNPVHSGGPQMSLYISGNFNLLNNYANIEILGRVAKEIVSVMGSVGDMSVSKLLTNIPKSGSNTSNILNSYNAIKDESTLSRIPQLIPERNDTKQFQVVIEGNIEKPSSVRTFKWVASEEEIKAAKAQINSQLQNILPTKVKELFTTPQTTPTQTTTTPTTQSTQPTLENAGTALKEAAKNAAKEQLKKALPSFWDTIE